MLNKEILGRLKNAGIENYLFEAKIIEEHLRKRTRNACPYDIDLENIITRRETREPLQYILGGWEFYGDVYKLNSDCLIPRPETEFLTEYIINNAKKNGVVLDLCSGSGCISISALKRRGDLTAVLIDISPGAVEISKENARLNGVFDRAEFYCFDIIKDYGKVLESLEKPSFAKRVARSEASDGCFSPPRTISNLTKHPPPAGGTLFTKEGKDIDIIVSNPPYLTAFEIEKIKSDKTEVSHEPEQALLGGEDGLDFYRFIINNYSRMFGDNTVTVFECGINQSKDIIKMFGEIGFMCEIIRDYAKIERVVVGY